jgi:hypothetical protein
VRAVVVAPEGCFVLVVMVRGCEGCDGGCWLCACWDGEEGEDVAFPWIAEWARKAARKLERKGRCVGILAVVCV